MDNDSGDDETDEPRALGGVCGGLWAKPQTLTHLPFFSC